MRRAGAERYKSDTRRRQLRAASQLQRAMAAGQSSVRDRLLDRGRRSCSTRGSAICSVICVAGNIVALVRRQLIPPQRPWHPIICAACEGDARFVLRGEGTAASANIQTCRAASVRPRRRGARGRQGRSRELQLSALMRLPWRRWSTACGRWRSPLSQRLRERSLPTLSTTCVDGHVADDVADAGAGHRTLAAQHVERRLPRRTTNGP